MADIEIAQGVSVPNTMVTRYVDQGDGTHAKKDAMDLNSITPGVILPASLESIAAGVIMTISQSAKTPDEYVYEYLRRISGPASASGNLYDMDTDSDLQNSVFEYQVPTNQTFRLARVNFELVDGAMQVNRFGGINTLASGCLFRIVNVGGSVTLLDFTNGVPIQRNADFAPLAGVDSVIEPAAGDDMLPVRFSIFKAGAPMLIAGGQRVQWTNRDDLSGLTVFRAMVQGVFV